MNIPHTILLTPGSVCDGWVETNVGYSECEYVWPAYVRANITGCVRDSISRMKVCVFGDFDPNYSRNKVVLHGLGIAGADLVYTVVTKPSFRNLWDVIVQTRKSVEGVDVVLVMYSELRIWVPLLRMCTIKPIVWDAFFSRYDAIINDRKLTSRYGIKALYHWIADALSVHLATYILLDTYEHIAYFRRTFGRSEDAYIRVLVGAEDPRNT